MSIQAKAESAAATASYLTNGGVFAWGALTFNQVLMLVGAVCAVGTLVINTYYQRRRDRRDNEFHQKRMGEGDNSRP